jgi:hypothetical protein
MICRFQGVQPAPMGHRHVPFWGILVFGKKLLPKSGHATDDFGPKRPKNAELVMCMSLFWTLSFQE